MNHQHHQIDNKVLKVQFPNAPGSHHQLQHGLGGNRPKTKNKKGSMVVAQLRDAVSSTTTKAATGPAHLQTQNNGSIAIGQNKQLQIIQL